MKEKEKNMFGDMFGDVFGGLTGDVFGVFQKKYNCDYCMYRTLCKKTECQMEKNEKTKEKK